MDEWERLEHIHRLQIDSESLDTGEISVIQPYIGILCSPEKEADPDTSYDVDEP